MLTWKLWRALTHPPFNNPIFNHISPISDSRPSVRGLFITYLFMFSAMGFCWSLVYTWIVPLVLPFAFLINFAYGIYHAQETAAFITQEKAAKRYDLLSILPYGSIGMCWLFCMRQLYKRGRYRIVQFMVRLVTAIFLSSLIIFLFVSIFLLNTKSSELSITAFSANTEVAYFTLTGIIISIGFYLDHIQTIIISSMIGVFIAAGSPSNQMEARIRAIGIYLSLQVITYIVTFLAISQFIPLHFISEPMGSTVIIFLGVGGILTFLIMREMLMWFLRAFTNNRLNSSGHEFSEVLQLIMKSA